LLLVVAAPHPGRTPTVSTHTDQLTPLSATRTLLTVEAAANRLSIGRTTMYALIGAAAIELPP
jgi:hypothetical protein